MFHGCRDAAWASGWRKLARSLLENRSIATYNLFSGMHLKYDFQKVDQISDRPATARNVCCYVASSRKLVDMAVEAARKPRMMTNSLLVHLVRCKVKVTRIINRIAKVAWKKALIVFKS
jgi:hypothetical protein